MLLVIKRKLTSSLTSKTAYYHRKIFINCLKKKDYLLILFCHFEFYVQSSIQQQPQQQNDEPSYSLKFNFCKYCKGILQRNSRKSTSVHCSKICSETNKVVSSLYVYFFRCLKIKICTYIYVYDRILRS